MPSQHSIETMKYRTWDSSRCSDSYADVLPPLSLSPARLWCRGSGHPTRRPSALVRALGTLQGSHDRGSDCTCAGLQQREHNAAPAQHSHQHDQHGRGWQTPYGSCEESAHTCQENVSAGFNRIEGDSSACLPEGDSSACLPGWVAQTAAAVHPQFPSS